MTEVTLRPIGIVRSPHRTAGSVPAEGSDATIEIHEPYRAGLRGIERNSHLIVLGWFDRASRDQLVGGHHELNGVFGLRSVGRPNPIGLAICRLIMAGPASLRVADLDFLDGTPIVDLKRYSPSWDCIFSARSSRDLRPAQATAEAIEEAIREAAAFHGEVCPAVVTAARWVVETTAAWGIPRKSPELTVEVGRNPHFADALQALTAATFGSGRLTVGREGFSTLQYHDQSRYVFGGDWSKFTVEQARTAPLTDFFLMD